MSTTNEYRFGMSSDMYMYDWVCVLNEMKMWEALVIDNILSMVACSRNDLSVCSINQLTD